MKVIYIAGPMSGYSEFNFPAFFKAEEILREKYPDAFIINPARLDLLAGVTPDRAKGITNEELLVIKRDCMQRDLDAIFSNTPDSNIKNTCLIVLLEGYLASNGADIELRLCKYLGWDSTTLVKILE